MNIFVSYSASERLLAETIAYRLRDEGHSVFYDRISLAPGVGYDSRIARAIRRCNMLIFIVSPRSLSLGSYALTELRIAQEKWDNPSGRILPILAEDMELDGLPPYLSAVTVLRPQGDLVAEASAIIRTIGRRRRRKVVYGALVVSLFLLVLGVVAKIWTPGLFALPGASHRSESVSVLGDPTNAGWQLNFNIANNQPIKEILYRFADEDAFKSTGFTRTTDETTGLPEARTSIEIPYLRGKRNLLIKYLDPAGREHGPFTVVFDTLAQTVSSAKDFLDITGQWVSFRVYDDYAYLYFSALLSYKNAFKEIEYSVDDNSVSRRVRFEPDWSAIGSTGISSSDETSVKIPATTEFVYVKLIFSDGTEWPSRKFSVHNDVKK